VFFSECDPACEGDAVCNKVTGACETGELSAIYLSCNQEEAGMHILEDKGWEEHSHLGNLVKTCFVNWSKSNNKGLIS